MSERLFTVPFPVLPELERRGAAWWTEVDGREVRLTNLDKVFWPEGGYTKGDLVAYYYNVARFVLPYLAQRPLTLKRMPEGIEGGQIIHKQVPSWTPDWITRCAIEPADGDVDVMLTIEDAADLLFAVNAGNIDLHPYHSRCEDYDRPDYMVFDLDPMPPAGFAEALFVARHVRVVLAGLRLEGYPKTSGATGVQVYVPVEPKHSYDETRELARRIGELIREVDPSHVTMRWSVRERGGKVFIDHKMNRRGASLAVAYSVRPQPLATVSTPLRWEEVEDGSLHPTDFTIRSIFRRLDRVGDLFAPVLEAPQDLNGALDALGVHHSRRDISEGRLRRLFPGEGRARG